MKTTVELPGSPVTSSRTQTNLLLILTAGLALPVAGADPAKKQSSDESVIPLVKVDTAISAAHGIRVRNLEVFALVGPDQIAKRDYLTLSQAMDKRLVRVHETRNSREASIPRPSSVCDDRARGHAGKGDETRARRRPHVCPTQVILYSPCFRRFDLQTTHRLAKPATRPL